MGSVQSAGVVAIASADGSSSGTAFPPGGATAAPGIPSLSATSIFVGMILVDGPQLVKGTLANGVAATVATPDAIKAAPVVGQGDLLYTATGAGVLQAWRQSDLASRWSHALSGTVSASPNLVCGATSGSPGTLYVATEAGAVYAIAVDSHGLDNDSPWPKYQRDGRNTGNPATPKTCN